MNYHIPTLLKFQPTEAIISVVVFILMVMVVKHRARKMKYKMPPGPKGLPLFGIFFNIFDYPAHLAYTTWSKVHGGIFTANIMGRKAVILNDVATIREAMVNCSPLLDDRTDWRYCFIRLLRGLSVMPYSKKWINTRRRTMSILREYGMGKSFMEQRIYDETHALIANILRDCDNGKANIDVKNRVRRTPVNIICNMLFSERYDYDDADLMFILETMEYLLTFLRTASTHDSLPTILRPAMAYSLKGFHAKIEILHEFLKSKVEHHEKTYKEGEQRDFVDAWIRSQKALHKKAVEQADAENNNKSVVEVSPSEALSFDEDSYSPVVNVLQDVLFAGAHSTGFALNWVIMLLTIRKDIQDKMYESIIDAIGEDGVPTMTDKQRLPLVEAVIHETLRVSTLVPLVGHACLGDVTLCGYSLPKSMEVTYNNWAVNHDETNFPDSYSFLPERWIKSDGTFDRDATSNYFPFGIGKRSCVGETLAKMELFIVTVTLFQSLEFLMPDDTCGPEMRPEIKHVQSFVLEPKPYVARVKKRRNKD